MNTTTDQQIVEKHLLDASFLLGVKQSKWDIIDQSWPDLLFAVRAICGKWWCIRVNLEGYPTTPPNGTFWNSTEGCPLQVQELPCGGALKDFDDGIEILFKFYPELYCPFDRAGLKKHPEWASKHPNQAWSDTKTITFYLESLHDILNSRGYRTNENATTPNSD